jgi:GNAT superfamily N-acetyltransferase
LIDVRRVPPEATFALRHRVLRSHEPLEALRLAGDDDPRAAHLAAVGPGGEAVGTAVVFPEAPPWDPAAERAWRVRGMATDEAWRNQGVGAAVLAAVVDHVRRSGGGLLWCNARLPAAAFYRRAGFEAVGDPWDEPHIGPHVAMRRHLEPSAD